MSAPADGGTGEGGVLSGSACAGACGACAGGCAGVAGASCAVESDIGFRVSGLGCRV